MKLEKPNLDKLKKLIDEDASSQAKWDMRTAAAYYSNDNDIRERKRYFIDKFGVLSEETRLSNTKLSHPFFAKLVDQKASYLLGKPFSVSTENETYSDALNGYFDRDFIRVLKNVCTDAVICGCSWLQVYYNPEGVLCFARIPSIEVIPVWMDGDHTKLFALIRVYATTNPLVDESNVDTKHVEYYTSAGVIRYQLTQGELKQVSISGHAKVAFGEEKRDVDFGRIPFVPFRFNAHEISLLKYIKPLIDDYDALTSDISNNIKDTPNNIKVVRGYTGDPGEFTRNIALYRTVFVSETGSVEQIATSLDTTACEAQLTRIRRDIFDAGNGVDAQDAAQGNTSGVAIRLRYADLDMSCQNMATEFSASLEALLYFIDADLSAKRVGDFSDEKVEFLFNTDCAVNESETIQNCSASVGVLSKETLLANHPWVTDVKVELERVDIDSFGDEIAVSDETSTFDAKIENSQNSGNDAKGVGHGQKTATEITNA